MKTWAKIAFCIFVVAALVALRRFNRQSVVCGQAANGNFRCNDVDDGGNGYVSRRQTYGWEAHYSFPITDEQETSHYACFRAARDGVEWVRRNLAARNRTPVVIYQCDSPHDSVDVNKEEKAHGER